MSGRKRKRGSIAKAIIVLTSITILNVIGISYAYWNNNLQITTSISIGDMDVQFDNAGSNCSFTVLEGSGELTARIEAYEIIVGGTVSSDYKGVLGYSVTSGGSVPAQYSGNVSNGICDSMEFLLDQNRVLVIENVYCGGNSFELNIRIEECNNGENINMAYERKDESYTNDFVINLQFSQSNR